MQDVTIILNKKMKMSELIDVDYNLLMLLYKLNISLGFGEKSVEAVCNEHGFDADCFLFLANFQSNRFNIIAQETFDTLPIEPFLYFLRASHNYFLEKRLPNIRRKLELVFDKTETGLREIVFRFFDGYAAEVKEHMKYEDEVVFPYIKALMDGTIEYCPKYSISIFESRHNDIEAKMSDLKQILMKYVSGINDQMLMINVLTELYTTEEELNAHTFIEDELVVPRIKEIEKTK